MLGLYGGCQGDAERRQDGQVSHFEDEGITK